MEALQLWPAHRHVVPRTRARGPARSKPSTRAHRSLAKARRAGAVAAGVRTRGSAEGWRRFHAEQQAHARKLSRLPPRTRTAIAIVLIAVEEMSHAVVEGELVTLMTRDGAEILTDGIRSAGPPGTLADRTLRAPASARISQPH